MVDVAFTIGSNSIIGADGLAIWYTETMGVKGPVFGSNDYWKGLAIFLDSYDNDRRNNNPSISIMINDGTHSYNHQTDGYEQVVAGCTRNFRNKPLPIRMRIKYLNNILTISVSNGMLIDEPLELCLRAENIILPKAGYFGLSAATGGVADNHDVFDFSVSALVTETGTQPVENISSDERQKFEAEFVQQKKEYDQARQKFKEEHPDKVREDQDEDMSKFYEDPTTRELRSLREIQGSAYNALKQLEAKINEITQMQSTHNNYLKQCASNGGLKTENSPSASKINGEFLPHEKSELFQTLRDLSNSYNDLKNYVKEIFTKTYKIEQVLGNNAQSGSETSQIRNTLDTIQNEIHQVRLVTSLIDNSKIANCPEISCVSSIYLTIVIIIQSLLILGFIYVRNKRDKAKFY